jgi:adsorption protein A
MKFFFSALLLLASINAYALTSAKIDLGPGLNSYQRFVIYPHIEKGLSALKVGDKERAIEEFLWARKRAPKSPATALYLANAYIASDDYLAAKEVLEQQLLITPKNQQLLKRLSNTLIFERDYVAASNALKEELKVNENNTIAQEKLRVVNQELANQELQRLKALEQEDPAQFLEELKEKK